jgi:hypothetical protein
MLALLRTRKCSYVNEYELYFSLVVWVLTIAVMAVNFFCRKVDIVDNMLQKLEKYADNLENIVLQRTAELQDEKQKTDMLLNRMLPPWVDNDV